MSNRTPNDKPFGPFDSRPDDTEYVSRQIKLIRMWMDAPPPLTVRGYRETKQVVGSVAQRVIPNWVAKKIGSGAAAMGGILRTIIPTSAIEGAINANLFVAKKWTSKRQVREALGIERLEDTAGLPLSKLDDAADEIHNWAVSYGSVAGAAAGAGGILVSVPSVIGIINLTVRTIRQIGFCYGYFHDDDIERVCILEILSIVGGGQNQTSKLASAGMLRELFVMVKRVSFKTMGEKAANEVAIKELFIVTIRQIAKTYGYQLTRSRLLTAVPIVGGGVGLLIDGNYTRKVGWTARRYYQRRWLMDRGRWPNDTDGILQEDSADDGYADQ